MTNGLKRVLSIVFLLAISVSAAKAELLQVIHTNDLHSHFDRSEKEGFGGLAAVKAVMDRLKGEAEAQGIDTLVLDGGDFSEGSQYYLADRGRSVLRVMNAMGYDAIVMGNHDWLMGPEGLDGNLGTVRPEFALLGANFRPPFYRRNTLEWVKPFLQVERAGSRIAVLGLTTDERLYSWRTDLGTISEPVSTARFLMNALRRENDFVFALTHIGFQRDMRLVQQTAIDLVVGGHSHSVLEKPAYAVDRRGFSVPIVQAGDFGQYVGDLLVDLQPGKPVQVIRYQLIPVHAEGPKHEGVARHIAESREQLLTEYPPEWLLEVMGHSDVPLTRENGNASVWSRFLTDTIRETAGADIAFDVTSFSGMPQPAGPINREQLFMLYPRVLDFSDRYGWTVWSAWIRGFAIRIVLQKAIEAGQTILSSGLTYDVTKKDGVVRVSNIRVGKYPIKALRSYKVALPEGVIRGAFGITGASKYLLRGARNVKVPIWTATADRLRKMGRIPADYVAISQLNDLQSEVEGGIEEYSTLSLEEEQKGVEQEAAEWLGADAEMDSHSHSHESQHTP